MNKKQLRNIFVMSALVYFTQGIGTLVSQPLYYYLKETLGIAVGTVMMLSSLTSLPWMIKPIYGILSDNFPIRNYKRKSYIILSSILSLTTCMFLGLSPTLPLVLFFGLMIIDSLGGAIKDVAVDGVMVEEGQRYNLTGKIQSVQWGALTLAQVLTGVVGGYIAEKADYHLAYLLISVFPLMILLAAVKYRERRITPKRVKLRPLITKYINALKNKQFILSALFLFLLWFSPAIGTPIFAKMRDELHLSKIWIGWLSTIGSICSVIGALIYYRVSQKINLTKWLVIGILLSGVSTIAYLYLTSTSVLVYAIVFGLSGMFVNLTMMDFMARACPKGTEATTFALLCSIVNFGTFCSNTTGGLLYNNFGYNGLVIISGVTTLMCLGFVPYLKLGEKS